MSELTFLYCAICYLFNIGAIIEAWRDLDRKERSGAIISLLISPVFVPSILGVNYYIRTK